MSTFLRKGIVAALVIGLILGVVGITRAAYVIRQLDNGNTEFSDPSVDRFGVGGNPAIRVGRQYFMVHLTNISEPYTYYFASPISGVLYSAFMVQNSAPIGIATTTLTFGVMVHASPGVFTHPNTGASFLIPPTVGLQGQIRYNQPFAFGVSSARAPDDITQMQGTHLDLRRGGIISIAVGGEGSVTNAGTPGEFDVWIIIDPR